MIILSYLFKQLEMGLVCHIKMLETMLSEKLKLDVGPLVTILSYLFNQLEMGLVENLEPDRQNRKWKKYKILFFPTGLEVHLEVMF